MSWCPHVSLKRYALIRRQQSSSKSSSATSKRSYTTVNLTNASSMPYSGMQISLLGTSSGVPTRARGVTSVGIRRGADHWLVDCGEGTQSRVRMSCTLNVSRLSRIFITHMHGDHTWGLLGVIASNLIGNDSPTPLTIYGPPGIADWTIKALRGTGTAYPHNLLNFVELGGRDGLQPDNAGIYTVLDREDFMIRAMHIKHTTPCLGYVFEEKTKRGTIKMTELEKLGVKRGPSMRQIQSQWQQETITLPGVLDESTGEQMAVAREQVMTRPVFGRKIVVLGDTCDPYEIQAIASDPCVLVHECTLPSHMERMAYSRGHSTGTMAAKFAQHVGARSLVLTHFSPRFTDDMLEQERLKVKQYYTSGEVFVGADFDVFDVPVRDDAGEQVTRYKYPFNDTEVNLEEDFPEALTTAL